MTSSGADPLSAPTLQTPAFLLDRGRLQKNIDRAEARARELKVAFRPHLKTAKSHDVARLIPSASSHGITVSTVKEAEYFGARGVDMLYAVCITPDKLARLAAVAARGAIVRLAVDSEAAVEGVTAGARELGTTFDVLVEIDSGEHRSGLKPGDARIVELARRLFDSAVTRFNGVYTHAGHAYETTDADEIRAIAEAERVSVVSSAEAIRAAGVPCEIVSVGSTPTMTFAAHLDGVTEVRAGVWVFHDLYQAALGTCTLDDIAATVLTTVIGHQPEHGTILVDAGGMALSKDRSTQALGPDGDCGYGLVADVQGNLIEGLKVEDAFQEHGLIRGPAVDFDRHPIGSRLRILPNHSCMTAGAYAKYVVVDGSEIVGEWGRVNEWV